MCITDLLYDLYIKHNTIDYLLCTTECHNCSVEYEITTKETIVIYNYTG